MTLTDVGRSQAVDVGRELFDRGLFTDAKVYASEFLRAQQTAWPLLDLLSGGSPTAAEIPTDLATLGAAFDPGHILAGLVPVDIGGLIAGILTLL